MRELKLFTLSIILFVYDQGWIKNNDKYLVDLTINELDDKMASNELTLFVTNDRCTDCPEILGYIGRSANYTIKKIYV